jgi:hypothetical protein
MSDEIGAEVSALDGYITGRNLELLPSELIVQSWRTPEFSDQHEDSIVTLRLEEVEDSTFLTPVHSHVPDEHMSYEQGGWQEYYFEPMREYFANRESVPRAHRKRQHLRPSAIGGQSKRPALGPKTGVNGNRNSQWLPRPRPNARRNPSSSRAGVSDVSNSISHWHRPLVVDT